MRYVSYVFLRRDTGIYFFRWTIPAKVRHLLGGRTEIKRSLHTDQRRNALRLARRLSVLLERATDQLMFTHLKQQDPPCFHLTISLFERLVDGSIRMEGVQLDPDHAEQDQKLLVALLGTATTASNVPADQRTLSDMVTAYFVDGDRSKKWTAKTRQELQTIYALMIEILGATKPLASLSRKDFAYLKEVLGKLPSNRSKNPLYRGKSVAELAAMIVPKEDLLSTTTINKNLGWVSSLMSWGQVHGYVSSNFAEGMTLAKAKRDDEFRQPYTDEEARKLREAIMRGEYGCSRAPYMRWIPLIGLYSGMRLNEIAQLALADFTEVDSVPVITINDEEGGKRLKTANSRRLVPVHPALVDAGLLVYVNALRSKGEERLFPELSMGRDGYGQTVSRWFRRYRQKLGLERDFHSLRHTVATKLRENDVPEDVVADILGHSRSEKETFGRYAKAATVRRTYEAITRLNYDEPRIAPRLTVVADNSALAQAA